MSLKRLKYIRTRGNRVSRSNDKSLDHLVPDADQIASCRASVPSTPPGQRSPSATMRSHHYARKAAQVLVDLPRSSSNSTIQPLRDAIRAPSALCPDRSFRRSDKARQESPATSSTDVPGEREIPNSVFFVSPPRAKDPRKKSYRARPPLVYRLSRVDAKRMTCNRTGRGG